MPSLRHLLYAALALTAAVIPAAAYSGYYAPLCSWSSAWTLSGFHDQLVCL